MKNYKNQTSFSRVMTTDVLPRFFMNHGVCTSLTLVTAIVEAKVISKAIPGAVCQKMRCWKKLRLV